MSLKTHKHAVNACTLLWILLFVADCLLQCNAYEIIVWSSGMILASGGFNSRNSPYVEDGEERRDLNRLHRLCQHNHHHHQDL